MAEPLGILPHADFKALLETVKFAEVKDDPRTRAPGRAAFDSMRAHLVELYAGVEAEQSFEDPAGRVVDCIPIEQQPSVRESGRPIAIPPDIRPVVDGGDPIPGSALPLAPLDFGRRDRHGNRAFVPPGTIPVHRVTLADLARFESVDDFVRKEPGPTTEKPSAPDADTKKNHRYAYTIQNVDNIGAHNSMAVYSPAIDADQVFSLAQHWYSGGDGDAHQTLEVGWQVYPAKYGHAQPVLFIFWTADNYKTTGAYNLDKPGFVQTNNAWTIGGALSPVSTKGGQQMEIEVTTYLFEGNWWIYVGGGSASDALGYYPTSLYNGGQMASKALNVLFGGETVCKGSGTWPDMGSGEFASAGWQQAAYQRNIYYYPPGGGAQWTNLDVQQPSPACYTLTKGAAAAPWGIYFFFGGSGGGNC
jgi:hypothetical protein